MNIVITMAGLGSRFQKAGYKDPKFKIKVKGKSLFEWSMMSLADFNTSTQSKYIFVTRKETDARDFITEELQKLEVLNVGILELDELTDGQATTALAAQEFWDEDDELVIYNIDTYVEPGEIKYKDIEGDGFIPCFKAPGEHWSFVKLGPDGNAVEVREKQRISDNCTIGLYYFKTAKLYKDLYTRYYKDAAHLEKNEKFIAPLYNQMIDDGLSVNISVIPIDKVHILGTPEEVQEFANS